MAARARVKFSSSGAGSIVGAFGKVGGSASGAQGKIGKFGSGIGSVFYKVMRNVGRMTMFSAGIQQMGKSATGTKRDMQGFASGSVTALSAVSKKFAELRRQYYFFKFAGQKLATPFKGMAGLTKKEEPTKKATPSRWLGRVKAVDPSSKEVEKATSAWQKFLAVLRGGDGTFSKIAGKVLNLKNVLTVLIASFTAISVAGGVAFVVIGYQTAKFAKRIVVDFMNIREAFRQYEISLGGIIKNTYALGKVMTFATKYAAEYPAMFEEVLDTFRSLAALPALKPMFQKADEQDLRRLMSIVQGLATLDPLQGVRGAGIALREALSGDMRSVRRRFEIPARAIADAGGYALEEITQDSQKALKAFHAFIKLNVPAKSMADAAMTIAIQVGNLRDKYRTFVNDMMKSTGAYWEVVTGLKSVNNWLAKVFASPAIKKWTSNMGTTIRAFVATLKGTMSDIDWSSYIDSGKLMEGLVESAVRIAVFLRTMSDKFSAPFLDVVTKISKILWSGLIPVIGTLVKAIGRIFWEGMKAAGKASMQSFVSGLASGAAFKSIASFVYNTMIMIGKLAGTAFMAAFIGSLNITGTLLGKASSISRDIGESIAAQGGLDETKSGFIKLADILQTAADYWSKAPEIGEVLSIDSTKVEADAKKVKTSLEAIESSILASWDIEKAKIAPEVVTPETPVKQQEWRVQNLKTQLAASVKLGISIEKRRALTFALAEAEKALKRTVALKKWEGTYAVDRTDALNQMREYEAVILKAKEAGKDLGVDFYVKKIGLQRVLDNFDELYGKIVDQKDAFRDLQSSVKSAVGSMEGWTESYKMGKKDAGALFIVVKKLQDIVSRKTPATDLLSLLKKRAELTDKAINKEKEYKKQIISTTKALAKSLAGLASGLQSSVLSFADKLKRAFLGIAPFAGVEPAPGQAKKPKTEIERKQASRELDFSRLVMEKIKDMMMVPANIFGLGRKAMTYEQGYGRGEYWQGQGQAGGQIPPYIKYMLAGINAAVGVRKGAAEFPSGRKTLAEMRMGLLEKAIPYTPYRSEERAEIYAKMVGAQADIMKSTLQATMADIQMQRDQLSALQDTAINTGIAIDKSDEIIHAIQGISVQTSSPAKIPSTMGRENMSGLNPSTGTAY